MPRPTSMVRPAGFLAVCLLIGLLGACKKDETRTVLKSPDEVTGFTVTSPTVVLSASNDSATVAGFRWQAPNYNFSAAITYTLLFDVPSDTSGTSAWGKAISVTVATDSQQLSYLGTDFNRVLNQLGLAFGTASTLVVRLKADVQESNGLASTVPSIYSSLTMTVTPYQVVLIYPKLYMAGDYQAWTPADQPGGILASVQSNGSYEGYINFPNAADNFKLCTQPNWNGTAYGWGGTATTLSSTGGNCYFGAGPAYCKVVADVKGLTLAITPTNWFVSGDFNSWSTTATPMTFNATTNQWVATGVSMTAGTHFKFAGDPAWNSSFGVDAKGNLLFGGGSGNIVAAQTGVFTVTLDLSQGAGNYMYSVK